MLRYAMAVTKPVGRRDRPAKRCRSLLLVAVAGAVLGACREGGESVPETTTPPAPQELRRAGEYAMSPGALYRLRGGAREAVAVLPGAGAGSDTLFECAVLAPGLGKVRFGMLEVSSDSALAAWATTGPGTCVGTLVAGQPPVRVLGFWPAAATDSLLWAPAGGYLAVLLDHYGQRCSLSVYDAIRGARLEMPWEGECEYAGDCDIERVQWLGGSLLNVRIRLGPAERSVPFEVNVEEAASLEMEEEY